MNEYRHSLINFAAILLRKHEQKLRMQSLQAEANVKADALAKAKAKKKGNRQCLV